MLGTAYAVRSKQHIVVDAIEICIRNPSGIKAYRIILSLIGVAFSVTLAVLSYAVVARTIEYGQLSGAMRIPMYYANSSFFFAGVLMAIHYCEDFVNGFRHQD